MPYLPYLSILFFNFLYLQLVDVETSAPALTVSVRGAAVREGRRRRRNEREGMRMEGRKQIITMISRLYLFDVYNKIGLFQKKM